MADDDAGREDTGRFDTGSDGTRTDDSSQEGTGRDNAGQEGTRRDNAGQEGTRRDNAGQEDTGSSALPGADRITAVTETFLRYVEVAAAAVFALLFAIGVVDLSLQIWSAIQTGDITDPRVVIGFIDTGLLLLIIVEVYQTVVAYTRESDTRRIVRLVIYTGVIAMVRKVIVFRTGEYPTTDDALVAAVSYTVIIVALAVLLYAVYLVTPPVEDGDAV